MQREGQEFKAVFHSVLNFNHEENNESNSHPILIAHGGFSTDFPLLITNCYKYDINPDVLVEFRFIDSMEILKRNGYERPGMDFMCRKYNIFNYKTYSLWRCDVFTNSL